MEKIAMDEIQQTETQIAKLIGKLGELYRQKPPQLVKNYIFSNLSGTISLRELFGSKNKLFVIHNMGQGCRYCTTWADGLNGFLPHLESIGSVVLVSKDSPEIQNRFAHSRQWRFRMASHGGGDYIREQTVQAGSANSPGIVCYEWDLQKEQIFRKNSAQFGPGDLFCSLWHILALGGIAEKDFTPQYNYWQRPSKLDDGGENVL